MTEKTVTPPEDPRRPQGSLPGTVFILGLLAVGLVNCSQPFSPITGVTPLSSESAQAPTPSSTGAAPIAPSAAPPPTSAGAPSEISERAKKILASLGKTPSAKDCQTGFTKLIRGEPFGFRRNSAALSDKAKANLNGAAAIATVCGAHKSEVAGHTDRSGGRSFNQKLSEDRAAAVKDYLIAQGAPGAALTAKGYGESRPLKGYRAAVSRRIAFAVTE